MKKLMFISILMISFSLSAEQKYDLKSFSQEEINHSLGIKSQREPWDTRDTILELGFLTFATIDLLQTYTFLYVDKSGTESLQLLGEKPSKKKLFVMAGLWGLGHVGVSYILPTHWLRNTWQVMGLAIHFSATTKNFTMGIRVSIE